MDIGLYGGGFDPVHLGHLGVAQAARGYVDEVWLMPCFDHLYGKKPVAPHHRIEMCNLAVAGQMGLSVCDFEVSIRSAGVAYDTLKAMTAKYGHVFKFIIGQDNADSIDKWRYSDKLLKEFAFIVVSCNKDGLSWYRQSPHVFIEQSVSSLRSTDIRQMLKERNPAAQQCLSPSVFNYIKENHLYEVC